MSTLYDNCDERTVLILLQNSLFKLYLYRKTNGNKHTLKLAASPNSKLKILTKTVTTVTKQRLSENIKRWIGVVGMYVGEAI